MPARQLLPKSSAIRRRGPTRRLVTARKNQRASTSDWMELERKRGISISSTVLQFDYDGYRVNLLDTPATRTSPRTPIVSSPLSTPW